MEGAEAVDAGAVEGVPSSDYVSMREGAADVALQSAKAAQQMWSDGVRSVRLVLELLTNVYTSDADHDEDGGGDDEEDEATLTLRIAVHGCLADAGIPSLVRKSGGVVGAHQSNCTLQPGRHRPWCMP